MGKIISGLLFVLGVGCFVMFFLYDNGHKVIFDTNGGSHIETQLVKDNELAIKP